jgi:hypothetical protein
VWVPGIGRSGNGGKPALDVFANVFSLVAKTPADHAARSIIRDANRASVFIKVSIDLTITSSEYHVLCFVSTRFGFSDIKELILLPTLNPRFARHLNSLRS